MVWPPLANVANLMAEIGHLVHERGGLQATVGLYNWETKPWGRQRMLLLSPSLCSVHELEISADGLCSWHCHQFKQQSLFCLEGRVRILQSSLNASREVHTLAAGDMLLTPPRHLHQFRAECPSRLLEIYVPLPGCVIDTDDIVRESAESQF